MRQGVGYETGRALSLHGVFVGFWYETGHALSLQGILLVFGRRHGTPCLYKGLFFLSFWNFVFW